MCFYVGKTEKLMLLSKNSYNFVDYEKDIIVNYNHDFGCH